MSKSWEDAAASIQHFAIAESHNDVHAYSLHMYGKERKNKKRQPYASFSLLGKDPSFLTGL